MPDSVVNFTVKRTPIGSMRHQAYAAESCPRAGGGPSYTVAKLGPRLRGGKSRSFCRESTSFADVAHSGWKSFLPKK